MYGPMETVNSLTRVPGGGVRSGRGFGTSTATASGSAAGSCGAFQMYWMRSARTRSTSVADHTRIRDGTSTARYSVAISRLQSRLRKVVVVVAVVVVVGVVAAGSTVTTKAPAAESH